METRLDRPNLGLGIFTTTSITHNFWHCYYFIVAVSLHRRQGSVARHSNQPSAIPHLLAICADIHHSCIFLEWELQLSASAPQRQWRINAAGTGWWWWQPLGHCHVVGGCLGVAFLSIFISYKMVWRKLVYK